MADLEVVEGAAATDQPTDPAPETAPDTTASDAASSQPTQEPDFTDPAQLPADLQPLAKRLMASYTKRMQSLAKDKEKVALVDRFDTDPGFQKELIAFHAQRLGLLQQQAQTAQNAPDDAVPDGVVAAARSKLPPELQWMAEPLAAAQYEAQKPLIDRQKAIEVQRRQDLQSRISEEYSQIAQELTTKLPGWEAHEDDMAELQQFLKSGAMRHPKFGSRLEILANVVTGNALATKTVTQRMAEAGRARTTTGQSGRQTVPNVSERIRNAKSTKDAILEAAKAAEAALVEQGWRIE